MCGSAHLVVLCCFILVSVLFGTAVAAAVVAESATGPAVVFSGGAAFVGSGSVTRLRRAAIMAIGTSCIV